MKTNELLDSIMGDSPVIPEAQARLAGQPNHMEANEDDTQSLTLMEQIVLFRQKHRVIFEMGGTALGGVAGVGLGALAFSARRR